LGLTFWIQFGLETYNPLVFGDFLVKKWVMDLKDEALIMGLKFVKI
jgi:hypothetical protein